MQLRINIFSILGFVNKCHFNLQMQPIIELLLHFWKVRVNHGKNIYYSFTKQALGVTSGQTETCLTFQCVTQYERSGQVDWLNQAPTVGCTCVCFTNFKNKTKHWVYMPWLEPAFFSFILIGTMIYCHIQHLGTFI